MLAGRHLQLQQVAASVLSLKQERLLQSCKIALLLVCWKALLLIW